MFAATDTPWAPWFVVRSDEKKRARLNIIPRLLKLIPHEELPRKKVKLPKRPEPHGYKGSGLSLQVHPGIDLAFQVRRETLPGTPASEADMAEARAKSEIQQAAHQEADQCPVDPHVLQVLADPQLQPFDDGLGAPTGHHLRDEIRQPRLRCRQQAEDHRLHARMHAVPRGRVGL